MSRKTNYVPFSKDSAKSPMSKSLPVKVAALSNSSNVTQQKWQSIKCKVIPSETHAFVSPGADLKIIPVPREHLIVLPLLHPSIQIWHYPLNINLVRLQQ